MPQRIVKGQISLFGIDPGHQPKYKASDEKGQQNDDPQLGCEGRQQKATKASRIPNASLKNTFHLFDTSATFGYTHHFAQDRQFGAHKRRGEIKDFGALFGHGQVSSDDVGFLFGVWALIKRSIWTHRTYEDVLGKECTTPSKYYESWCISIEKGQWHNKYT